MNSMICPNILSVDGWIGFTHTQDTKDTNNSTLPGGYFDN
jgi:hypothetical protein